MLLVVNDQKHFRKNKKLLKNKKFKKIFFLKCFLVYALGRKRPKAYTLSILTFGKKSFKKKFKKIFFLKCFLVYALGRLRPKAYTLSILTFGKKSFKN